MRGRKLFSLPYILFPLITLIFPTPGSSQDSTNASTPAAIVPFPSNEISLGIGAAYSPEKDIFNVQGDVAAGTNVGISIAYLRNLDDKVALGINLYGYFKSLDNVELIVNGAPKRYKLEVSTMNIGAEFRYTLSTYGRWENFRPYVLGLVSYSTGNLSNDELGSLSISGFSGGGGLGAEVALGDTWGLALEGTASFGSAKWEQPPFSNSTSDDFNPTMYSALLRVTYLWE